MDEFISPTLGIISFAGVCKDIADLIRSCPEAAYRIIVGSDSQMQQSRTCYVTVVVLHRKGKGARFYYTRCYDRRAGMRQRIIYETTKSLECGWRLVEGLKPHGLDIKELEIHIDVGRRGESRELIREIVGMVTGSGYRARIKPDSFGASSVADKFTK